MDKDAYNLHHHHSHHHTGNPVYNPGLMERGELGCSGSLTPGKMASMSDMHQLRHMPPHMTPYSINGLLGPDGSSQSPTGVTNVLHHGRFLSLFYFLFLK